MTYDEMTMVATITGTASAVLVQFRNFSGGCAFHLITDSGNAACSDFVANGDDVTAMITQADVPVETTDTRYRCPGRLILSPGLHRVGYDGVLDTRTLAIHRFMTPQDTMDSQTGTTLSISPDERSFVRHVDLIGSADSKSKVALAVTDFVADRSYILSIDRGRMHYSRQADLNSAWLAHHFEWTRDANGIDQLVERQHFSPLPYRGELSRNFDNGQVYRLEPVGEEVRIAIEEFLVSNLNAERQPIAGDYEHGFLIGGKKVTVNFSTDFDSVAVCLDATVEDSVGQAIADGFDAKLATGKYDPLFRV